MKSWNIEVFLLDEAGNEKPASCFTKAVYNLHPSFLNPVQSTCFPHCHVRVLANLSSLQPLPSPHSDAKTKAGENST